MPTARKLLSGKWFIQVRRKGYPSYPITRTTKGECEKDARAIEHQMDLGSHHLLTPKSGDLLLSLAFDRYFKSSRFKDKRATTRKAEAGKAAAILKHLGSYSLQNLNEERIAKYRDDRLLEKTRYGRLPSPNTIRLEMSLLAAVFKVARQEWAIKLDSPLRQVRKPNCQSMRRDRRLEQNEEVHLLEILKSQPGRRLYFLVMLVLHCCLRPGEAAGIKKANINVKDRSILFPRSDTKSNRPKLTMLTDPALVIVKEALAVSPKDSPYLIGTRTKAGEWRSYDYACSWGRAKEQLALEGVEARDLRVHDLRHEAISRLFEDTKLSDGQISQISGHTDSTTLWSYRHLRGAPLLKLLQEQAQQTMARFEFDTVYGVPPPPVYEDEDEDNANLQRLASQGNAGQSAAREKPEALQIEIDELIEASRNRKLSVIEEEKLEYLIRIKKQVSTMST